MWQSQDDIVKDLASLNDFGTPGDMEPYKILYSIGRGSEFKEKHKSSEKFFDSRTGEVIDIEDEVPDYCDYFNKGRGRGSLLGGFSRSKFQLQQQLRLARPLGSGDEAIESYYRRNQPAEGTKISASATECDSDTKNGPIAGGILNANLNSDKIKHRVKAVRSSSTGTNALIAGLLTKSKENSETKLTYKEGNSVSNFNEKNLVTTKNINYSVSCNDSSSTLQTDCNEFSTVGSSPNGWKNEDEFLKRKCNGQNSYLKEICTSLSKTQTLNKAVQSSAVDDERLNFDNEEKQGNRDLTEVKCDSGKNFFDSNKQEDDRDEKYKLLGEKLNRLRKIDPKASESGMYDFSEISRYIAPIKIESNRSFVPVTMSSPVSNYFVVNDEDFPPLRNESLKPVN